MTRVLVVGSGIAGITAALHARDAGAEVVLVTKGALEDGNTRYAQGGVAAAIGADDSAAAHAEDTRVAGAGLADAEAVEVLVTEGPERVRDLIALGVPFDRDAEGALVQGLEAAHSAARILHAGGDATGAAIETTLARRVREAGIELREHAFLVDLVGERAVTGIRVLIDGRTEEIPADAVVLATGGAGQLYAHTTNPAGATGDGIAAALRAGAVVADLEFVQFHPTALAVGDPFLVSEAVRGEGAVLRGDDGRRFAFDAHPDGELAPRDVVARAIHRQMRAQAGRPVRLDATALGAVFLARRFPTIDAAARARGLDWSREPIPVTPAAHYLMGGVATDLDGRTSIPGLYAVGETARTGVHGANRLASNSLLEAAVFGARAGRAAAVPPSSPSSPSSRETASGCRDSGIHPRSRHADAVSRKGGAAVADWAGRAGLQRLMWEHAGLERDEDGLAHAARTIARWRAELPAPRTIDQLEDANLLDLADAVVAAARARTASVGAHYRRDERVAERTDAATALAGAAC